MGSGRGGVASSVKTCASQAAVWGMSIGPMMGNPLRGPALDPVSGEFTRYDLPPNANPRAVELDAQGAWWIVFGSPNQIAQFDPQTEELTTYSIGMYAHSIAIDSAGHAWANGHFRANPGKVVRINPQDGTRQVFDIPDNNSSNRTGLPISYDLRIDANDVVWGSDLNWNRIYKLEPQTGAVTHYELPNSTSGPVSYTHLTLPTNREV